MTNRKTIAITGGAQGIGRGIAQHFVGKGWRVALLDSDEEALAEMAAAHPEEQCLTLKADVGKEADVQKAFAKLAEWLDDAPLDALVNNAGIADPYSGPLEELSLDQWQGWVDASLTAAFLCSRAAMPLMKRAERSAIVNISSTRANQSEEETFAYAAAKGGLSALTHSMAVTLGPKIRVNAVLPGWIETGPFQKESERSQPEHRDIDRDQHPVGRIGTVQDIADAVDWLIGDASGFVTGQQIVVDGGMSVKMIYAH